MTLAILCLTLVSFFIFFYVYAGYPILLWFLSTLGLTKKVLQDEKTLPNVALLISCYNEIEVIDEKIENTLAIDYPKEKLEIIIISDGSDDGTDEAIKKYSEQNISLIRQEGRLGKTSAINLAMVEVKAEIVVFSDANAMYEAGAIKKLVRNFADKTVGYVVGAALYTDGDTNAAAASEDIYWKYEVALKRLESSIHSVVGGDGAMYAIRSELFITLDAKDINDFVNPLQIIEQGYRGVFEHEARCFEETAGDFNKEAKRKERIVNRSFRGLMKVKSVMNPFKSGFFSLEIISHKLLRWLMPIFIAVIALGSIYLSYQGYSFFQLISCTGLLFLWLAQVGYFQSSRENISSIFFIPYYFLMVNYYSLVGILKAITGNIQVTWSSPRHNEQTNNNLTRGYLAVIVLTNITMFKVFVDSIQALAF